MPWYEIFEILEPFNSNLGQNNDGNKRSTNWDSERSIQSHTTRLASEQPKNPAKIVTNSTTARYKILS